MKEEILNAVKVLSNELGLEFTLDELASTLKISKKTIYKYFKSKEKMIEAIIDEIFVFTKTRQKEILDSDLLITEKIRELLFVLPPKIELLSSENIRHLRIYYPRLYQKVDKLYNEDWNNTFSLMEKAKELGLMREFHFDLFRTLYVTGVLYDYKSQVSYENRLRNIIDILFEGVLNNDCTK